MDDDARKEFDERLKALWEASAKVNKPKYTKKETPPESEFPCSRWEWAFVSARVEATIERGIQDAENFANYGVL